MSVTVPSNLYVLSQFSQQHFDLVIVITPILQIGKLQPKRRNDLNLVIQLKDWEWDDKFTNMTRSRASLTPAATSPTRAPQHVLHQTWTFQSRNETPACSGPLRN